MIDNSDTPGHWQVRMVANDNVIVCFQCPTLQDARDEVTRLAAERSKRKLPTGRAFANQLLSGRRLGPEVPLIESQ